MQKARKGRRAGAWMMLAIASLLAGAWTSPARAQPPDQADFVEPYERDVYVIVGSTLRTPDETTDPEEPLFSDSGVSLRLTWGQWTAASAESTARSTGDRTDVRLELAGLVPGGVYSVFWGTLGPDSENPLCPGVERTLPLTGLHFERQIPDASSFIAGLDGSASYRGRVDGNLLDASQVYFSVIYHFDGMTYDPLPNRGEWQTYDNQPCRSSFGQDAMRQLLVLQKW